MSLGCQPECASAIAAAALALAGDGTHRVSLDDAIATMRRTGLDMPGKYRETVQGGLAVHVMPDARIADSARQFGRLVSRARARGGAAAG